MGASTARRASALLLGLAVAGSAAAQQATVQAVLFYSPTCPHCHDVMSIHLPPLLTRFGPQLQIVAIDVSSLQGRDTYMAVVQHFGLGQDRLGVPALAVGDTVLVGSGEIPDLLPGIVERGLAGTGIGWPQVPALLDMLRLQGILPPRAPPADTLPPPDPATRARAAETTEAALEVSTEPPPTDTATDRDSLAATATASSPNLLVPLTAKSAADASRLGWRDRFALDRAGNTVAVAALVLMIAALGLVIAFLLRPQLRPPRWPTTTVILLAAAGITIAAYLAWVEITGHEAVCGPVGRCNTVQQSRYARLFGWLPVGLLGVGGYVAILAGYLATDRLAPERRRLAARLTWLMTLTAVAFSAYLTVLEPFVIGATCMWCVTSALIATLLLLGTSVWARSLRAL